MKIIIKNSNLIFLEQKPITTSIIGEWCNGDNLISDLSCQGASGFNTYYGVGADANWNDCVGKVLAKIKIWNNTNINFEMPFFIQKDGVEETTLLCTSPIKYGMNTINILDKNYILQENEHIVFKVSSSDQHVFSKKFIKYSFGSRGINGSGNWNIHSELSTLMDMYFVDAD